MKNNVINNLAPINATTANKKKLGFVSGVVSIFLNCPVSLFDASTTFMGSQVDEFAYNVKTGEILVGNRYKNSHTQLINIYGTDKDTYNYILGYINHPGTSAGLPAGWMTDMTAEKTISLRLDGSFHSNSDYNKVHRLLDILANNGAPADYGITVLFGENTPGTLGFLNDTPYGKTIHYNNIVKRDAVVC